MNTPLQEAFLDRQPASAQRLVASLGPASPAFREANDSLMRLYDALSGNPALSVRFTHWHRCLSLATRGFTGDRALFLKHTYLATLARLLAYLAVRQGRPPSDADLEGVLNGDYFNDKAGLPYLVEEDFFVWPFTAPTRSEGLALARKLLNVLQASGASSISPDAFLELCQALESPVEQRPTRKSSPNALVPDASPYQSVLDPSCGKGAILCQAIHLKREAFTQAGLSPTDILLHILDSVVGVDTHPLALAVARTSYLLALGDLLDGPRGEVTIPVFLADTLHPPQPANAPPEGVPAYAVQIGDPPVPVYVPRSLVLDPVGLDYLLPFMKGKYAKAVLNAKNDTMLGRAWYSFHNFLVTPTTNRKPFALTEPEAEVMVQTQRTLLELTRAGHGAFWYTVLRNALGAAAIVGKG